MNRWISIIPQTTVPHLSSNELSFVDWYRQIPSLMRIPRDTVRLMFKNDSHHEQRLHGENHQQKRRCVPELWKNLLRPEKERCQSRSTHAQMTTTKKHDVTQLSPSPVWQYAVRSEDKSYATCRLCDKRISTSNWSTSSLRRHLIQMHNKSELMLSKKHKRNVTPDAPQRVREKFHKLSVEATIKDSLPFNAFNKPGLSRLIEEAIPGKKNLLARNFTLWSRVL